MTCFLFGAGGMVEESLRLYARDRGRAIGKEEEATREDP